MVHHASEQRSTGSSTDLSATRTRMAADRTLMAWIRTALSLLSFGFTIYKVLQAFEEAGGILPGRDIHTPRAVGLFLTGAGTVAMLMGTTQYIFELKELRQLGRFPLIRPPLIMATTMSITGVVLFVSIITKIF